MKIKKIIAGLLVATTAFSLAACGNSGSGDTKKSDADTSEKKEIVYGKSQGPYTELFEDAIVPILEKEGYTLKAVDLSDLQTADVALNDGDVDVNVVQHTWIILIKVTMQIWLQSVRFQLFRQEFIQKNTIL